MTEEKKTGASPDLLLGADKSKASLIGKRKWGEAPETDTFTKLFCPFGADYQDKLVSGPTMGTESDFKAPTRLKEVIDHQYRRSSEEQNEELASIMEDVKEICQAPGGKKLLEASLNGLKAALLGKMKGERILGCYTDDDEKDAPRKVMEDLWGLVTDETDQRYYEVLMKFGMKEQEEIIEGLAEVLDETDSNQTAAASQRLREIYLVPILRRFMTEFYKHKAELLKTSVGKDKESEGCLKWVEAERRLLEKTLEKH